MVRWRSTEEEEEVTDLVVPPVAAMVIGSLDRSVAVEAVGDMLAQLASPPLLLVLLPPRSLSPPVPLSEGEEPACRFRNGSWNRSDEETPSRRSRNFASSLARRLAASRAARAARRAPSGPVTQAARRIPSGGGLARAVQGGGSSASFRSVSPTRPSSVAGWKDAPIKDSASGGESEPPRIDEAWRDDVGTAREGEGGEKDPEDHIDATEAHQSGS